MMIIYDCGCVVISRVPIRVKEEALKDQAMDFYRQLMEHGFKPFDGASIDFHRKRDPVVFIPRENLVLTTMRRERS